MADVEITPEFKEFIEDIILYRCLVTKSSFQKYFDNNEAWIVLRQAFVHKSFGAHNYELLEFEGDKVLNLAVSEYIRKRFPKVVNVEWNTRLNHNLISGKTLARVAIDNKFNKYAVYGKDLERCLSNYTDPTDCRDYLAMNEDIIEALCGAITRILNGKTQRGTGYNACFNFITSMLDPLDLSLRYEDVFDAKSRMKELFERQGWSRIQGCRLSDCLRVFELTAQPDGKNQRGKHPPRDSNQLRNFAMNAYRTALGRGVQPDPAILNTTNRYLALGMACVYGDPVNKKLYSVKTGNKIAEVEQAAAEDVLTLLRRKGIFIVPNDPQKRTQ